ncbi:MAG: exopolysaccharide biosynthesis polyprenyl glycosylphosphotransferase [Verrucomicrobia bacterium]|nr:exopolysaccharide biosynthesis polyprenyl glycosylphosphotransferase [Verrucomicrobiota bacterium]
MISERSRGLYAVHSVVQAVLVTALFWGWLFLVSQFYAPGTVDCRRYAIYSVLTVVGLMLKALTTAPARRALLRLRVLDRLRDSFVQTLWISTLLLFFLVSAKDKSISRLFLFTFLPLTYLLLAYSNSKLPAFLARHLFAGNRVERTILYNTGGNLKTLGPWLRRQERMGLRVLGMLSDAATDETLPDLPVLGGTEDLERVLTETKATQILISGFPMFKNLLQFLTALCERRGIRMLIVADFEDKFGQAVTMVDEDGIRFLTLRDEPLESPFNRLLKRILDIAVSLPVVVGILPFTTLVVWLLQRRQAPGPVFYIQPRAGMQNQPFGIFKYRSMYVDNPDVNRQTSKHDERIYPAGRWLRRLSIDELPQFLNVLKGSMSVVGPRPHLDSHNEQWSRIMANYHVRTFVKPGITGLAQVRGFRGEATTDEALRLRVLADIEYIENWSIALDALIILRTAFQVVVPPKMAY